MQSPVLPISAPSCLLQRLARGFRCGYCPAHPQKAERGSGGGPAGVWVAPWQTDSGVVVSASPWRISACLALRFCVVRGLSYRVLASGAHKVSLHDSDSSLPSPQTCTEGREARQTGGRRESRAPGLSPAGALLGGGTGTPRARHRRSEERTACCVLGVRAAPGTFHSVAFASGLPWRPDGLLLRWGKLPGHVVGTCTLRCLLASAFGYPLIFKSSGASVKVAHSSRF